MRVRLSDPATGLVLPGGCKAPLSVNEARQMLALVDEGLLARPALLEEFSSTTAENAWCVTELLRGESGLESITLVCAGARVPLVRVLPSRVAFAGLLGEDPRRPLEDARAALVEVRAALPSPHAAEHRRGEAAWRGDAERARARRPFESRARVHDFVRDARRQRSR